MPDANPKRPDQKYQPDDAGAYIGHEPELAAETIPGGVPDDAVRVAAVGDRPPTPSDDRAGTDRPAGDPTAPR